MGSVEETKLQHIMQLHQACKKIPGSGKWKEERSEAEYRVKQFH